MQRRGRPEREDRQRRRQPLRPGDRDQDEREAAR